MKVKIKYINGIRLKRSIIAGAVRVKEKQQHLNDINVFPVPDGDTGTNMAMTLESISSGAQGVSQPSLDAVGDAIAESAIQGARGNSGVILAQFFQGFTEAIRGRMRLTPAAFSQAATTAVEKAKEAIANPREGTILTVMRDWASYISEHAPHKQDFLDLLSGGLQRAKHSLAETPKKLKVLEKAGVVDSGAEGFVHLLEGIIDFIRTGQVAAITAGEKIIASVKHHHSGDEPLPYQFCTECLISGSEIDKTAIRERLMRMGDSLIVIGSSKRVRVHIHSNEPDQVFETLADYGTVSKTKIDDMWQQVKDQKQKREGIALVTDSTCDLPPERLRELNVHVIPVRVNIGEQSYLDRVEMTSEDFYLIMQDTREKLSTSLPSPGDYREVYQVVAEQNESMIGVHLASVLSGTFNSARVAARDTLADMKKDLIDSRTTSAALGLIVQKAGKMIQAGKSHDEVVTAIKKATEKSRIFLSVPTLKNLIRSGRVNWAKGFVGTALNLKPVITLDPEGHVVQKTRAFGGKQLLNKVYELAADYANTLSNPEFGIVHVLNLKTAEMLKERLLSRFGGADVFITDASPALGVHTGIGSVAIAVLGD